MNRRPHQSGWMALAGVLLLTAASPATQVDWSGVAFSTNVTSTGQAWDDTWSAELGSFNAGFTPEAGNTAQWAANWKAASRSAYQPSTRFFTGTYSYSTNTAPFSEGARAYFWIFRASAPQGEWLLLTTPAWTWPVGSAFDPIPRSWTSTDATTAIVGQLPGAGGNLTSAAVMDSALPPLTFAEWRALFFTSLELANAAVSGATADPDQDGASNFTEYGAGTQPRRASSFPPPVSVFLHAENSQTYAAARLDRSTRVTGFSWQAQAGNDLLGWSAPLTTLTEFPWAWTVRRTEPITNAPRGFFRFRLAP